MNQNHTSLKWHSRNQQPYIHLSPITQTDQDVQEPYNDAEGYFGQILKVAFQNSTAVHTLFSHHPNRPRWTRTIQWCGGLFWTNPIPELHSCRSTYLPSPKPIKMNKNHTMMQRAILDKSIKVAFQNSTAVHPLISHHPNRPRWTRTIQWCRGLFWTNPKSGIPEINSCTSTYLPSPKPTKMNKNHTMMRRAILDKSIKVAFQNSTAVHPLISHHPNRPRWTRTIQWCGGLFWTNPKSGIPEINSCTSTYLPSPKPTKMNKNHTMMRRAILDKS